MTIQLKCAQVWGGIDEADTDVCSQTMTASLYSKAFEGSQGGDIYYFSVCGSDSLTRIALADVSGHGQMVTDTSNWMYEVLASKMQDAEGKDILCELNEKAIEKGYQALTTSVVVSVYRGDYTIRFAYAGHPPMLMKQSQNPVWQEIKFEKEAQKGNIPLGISGGTPYDLGILPVEKGDQIFLYTDGLLDTTNRAGELFGKNQLIDFLNGQDATHPAQIKKSLQSRVQEFSEGQNVRDDVTYLIAQVN